MSETTSFNIGYLDACPRRRDDLECHLVDDEVVIFDPVTEATHRLNKTARSIWELCDGERNCAAIAQQMTNIYDVPAEIADQDVCSAVDTMLSNALLRL